MAKNSLLPSLLQQRQELIAASPAPYFVVSVEFPDANHKAKFLDYASARDYFTLFTLLPCSVVLRRVQDFFNEDDIIKKVKTNAEHSPTV